MGRGYNWLRDEIASAGRRTWIRPCRALGREGGRRRGQRAGPPPTARPAQAIGGCRHRRGHRAVRPCRRRLRSRGRRRRVVGDAVRLQAKLSEANLSNVEVVQAGSLTYEHRGRPADFVYSRFALHHLPDFWKAVALARVRRIVRPGGVLRLWDVVYDFDPAAAEERIEAWCATGGRSVEGEWSRAELEEHVREEHSTFRWLLDPMIERCGFAIEDAVYSPDDIFGKYVARAT